MRNPFEVNPSDGRVTLYEKASGKPISMWPIDAREALASGDFYTAEFPDDVRKQMEEDEKEDPDNKDNLVSISGGGTPVPSTVASFKEVASVEVKKSVVAGETFNPFAAPSLVKQMNMRRQEREAAKTAKTADKTATKAAPVSAKNREGLTREKLDAMGKNELVSVAERNRIEISATTMTAPQIKDEIVKKLEIQ